MKISRVKAVNFMGVENIDVVLNKGVNTITGENGAGKSSFFCSIVSTLCGKRFTPDKAVRTGKNKAEVEIDMGDYTVEGTYTKDSRVVEVSSKDSGVVPKAQEFLNKVVGKLSFDPMKFERLDPKEQAETLRELVGLNVDDIESRYKEVQAERAQINKNKTLIQEDVNAIEFEPGTPDEEVSLTVLTGKLQGAMEFNNALGEKKKQENDRMVNIHELETRIKLLQQHLEGEKAKFIEGHDDEYIEVEAIHGEISAIENTNKNVRAKQKKDELVRAVNLKTHEYKNLGQTLKALDKTKAERIAAVKMPVEGLSLTKGYVMFGELPLKQVNTAQRIKICVAIAMAMNPKLKTVFCEADKLTPKTQKILEDFIIEKGYQALIEIAAEGAQVGIVIVDGKIKK